jgi:hypothetical protein
LTLRQSATPHNETIRSTNVLACVYLK